MDTNKICIVLVRLFAVALIVAAIRDLASFSTYFVTTEGVTLTAKVGVFSFVFVVPAVFALLLWSFPATLVGIVAPGSSSDSRGSLRPEDLLTVGMTLLGVYIAVFGLLDLLYVESMRFFEKAVVAYYSSEPQESPPSLIAGRIAGYAQIILGIVLVFGRDGISRIILRARGRSN